jgi:hypothetical protein
VKHQTNPQVDHGSLKTEKNILKTIKVDQKLFRRSKGKRLELPFLLHFLLLATAISPVFCSKRKKTFKITLQEFYGHKKKLI